MKNKLCIFGTILVAIPFLAGCDDVSKLPTISKTEVRSVNLRMSIDQDAVVGAYIITHFNDSSVGYIALDGTIEQIIAGKGLPYTAKYENHKYIINNTNTSGKCIIDFDKQTLTYDNFDKYYCSTSPVTAYNDCLISGGKEFFVTSLTEAKYVAPGDSKRVIDISKYNIPMYFDGNFGYVPIEFLRPYLFPFIDFQFIYNGSSLYLKYISDKTLESRQKFYLEGDIFNKDYMEYTYNLFALELDTVFGLDERNLRYNSELYKFSGRDAYSLIAPYHDKLTSLEMNVSDNAYIDILTKYYDDGGHSGYGRHNCLIDENAGEIRYGEELTAKLDIVSKLDEKRTAQGLDPISVIKKQTGLDTTSEHAYEEVGDTAFITFDQFTVGSATPGEITINNYWENTTNLVTYANEQIRKNSNIENLVIDLSLNGGGTSVSEHFIASWLCNGVTTKVRNTKDKTYQESRFYADINHDGVYNQLDYIDPNINLYCITSIDTFSCGNLLACHLYDLTNCKFIGAQAGGGSCLVWDGVPTGLGVAYQLSTCNQLGRQSSTSYSDFTTNEDGLVPDFYPISYDDSEIANFYDRTEILRRIHEQD